MKKRIFCTALASLMLMSGCGVNDVAEESSSNADKTSAGEDAAVEATQAPELEGYKLQDEIYRRSQQRDMRDYTIRELINNGCEVEVNLEPRRFV